MALKAFLVKHLDSNREGFESDPNILINVTFIDRSKTTLSKNVIRTEAFGDGLKFKESESYDVSVKQCVFTEILKVARC